MNTREKWLQKRAKLEDEVITNEKFIELIDAALSGKTIQMKSHSGVWMPIADANFDGSIERYRIKP